MSEPLAPQVAALLGPGGTLETRLPGFRARPGQRDMAALIARAIEEDPAALVVAEGGTGIGKTLAYLVPALLSGKKTVVATGTKTLQEQIFFKDLPALLDAAQWELKATYMKGRANYLCWLRFEEMAAQPIFRFNRDGQYFDRLAEWARQTETGDRAELDIPEDFASWPELTSTSESCLGTRCRHHDRCFITKMRRRAQAADLIIVNHHLYFADLALRERLMGEVIPAHELVVFDEAHGLEGVATQAFGHFVSNWKLYDLADDVQRFAVAAKLVSLGIPKLTEEIKSHATRFFETFAVRGERFRFEPDSIDADQQALLEALLDGLLLLARQLDDAGREQPDAEALADRVRQLGQEFVATLLDTDRKHAYWGENRRRGCFLYASPLSVAAPFQERFLARKRPAIFTSATLSTEGNLRYFKSRLGLPEDLYEGVFPSPFDYRHRTLTYLPRYMPEPNEAGFAGKCAEHIEKLVTLTNGAALVLFTSYANMEQVYARLEGKLRVPLLKQGQAPRTELLERFRERADSVLFATGSFWQGVDVVGEALRMVIIDKLPFESPGEPVTEARLAYLREDGGNPFADYQLPTAILQLKQGVGRLIRSADDWGLVVLLDRRLSSKGYGKKFLTSLPDSVRVDRFDLVESWWQQHAE